ncbi:MAG: tail fiber protein [Betaproteobacteria bacterium]
MSNAFLGEIRLFTGNFAPKNWAFCNGQLLPIPSNQALFSLLGKAYGGDGKSTFGLPNLQDRVALGQGQGPGLSMRSLGSGGGENNVVITTDSMALHSHPPAAFAGSGDQALPDACTWAQSNLRDKQFAPTPNVEMAPNLIGSAGADMPLPHENRAPFLVVNFIIALVGVYPQ